MVCFVGDGCYMHVLLYEHFTTSLPPHFYLKSNTFKVMVFQTGHCWKHKVNLFCKQQPIGQGHRGFRNKQADEGTARTVIELSGCTMINWVVMHGGGIGFLIPVLCYMEKPVKHALSLQPGPPFNSCAK